MTDLKTALWCDLTTDAERSAWLLLGRGYETGVVAKSMQNDLARAYQKLTQQQEPVAWITDREGLYFDKQDAFRDSDGFIKPLFLAPLPRKWQGLTDDEVAKAWCKSKGEMLFRLEPFARAIEAKLKEKNT
jgi:hypothetical protein